MIRALCVLVGLYLWLTYPIETAVGVLLGAAWLFVWPLLRRDDWRRAGKDYECAGTRR